MTIEGERESFLIEPKKKFERGVLTLGCLELGLRRQPFRSDAADLGGQGSLPKLCGKVEVVEI